MTDEEIRLRCLEAAMTMFEAMDNSQQLFTIADNLMSYVTKDRYPTQGSENKITFEKVSQERNEK